MKKRQAIHVDPNSVPEVVAYLFAKEALDEFITHYAAIMQQRSALVEVHNSTLEAADKALRGGGYSAAPFILKHFTTKYSAEEAFNLLGHDVFLAVGGKIEQKAVYEVDKDRFEAAYAQGKIPEEVVDKVRTETPTYSQPKPITG